MRISVAIAAAVLLLGADGGRVRPVGRGVAEDPRVWLQRHAVPLATVQHDRGDDDLRPLLPSLASAEIVGLGEATHGTHEFFAIKRRFIQLLVLQAGFRTIAIEAPFAEMERVRDFIRTGAGDPAEMIQSTDYFFWDTQELLETILWARAQNAAGLQPPIDLAGVDVAHPHTAIDLILTRVTDSQIADRYSCLTSYAHNPFAYARKDAQSRQECRTSIAAVRPLLTARGADSRLLMAARVVEQGEEALATRLANRDAAMAENLAALHETQNSGGTIFFGHNEHVGKVPYTLNRAEATTSTGALLAERYGHRYFALGTMALAGTFWAGDSGFITLHALPAPSPADYASFFRAAGQPILFIPLRGAVPRWLDAPRPFRFAASTVPSRERPTIEPVQDLNAKFDAVIYFEHTTPSQLRHFPRLP